MYVTSFELYKMMYKIRDDDNCMEESIVHT